MVSRKYNSVKPFSRHFGSMCCQIINPALCLIYTHHYYANWTFILIAIDRRNVIFFLASSHPSPRIHKMNYCIKMILNMIYFLKIWVFMVLTAISLTKERSILYKLIEITVVNNNSSLYEKKIHSTLQILLCVYTVNQLGQSLLKTPRIQAISHKKIKANNACSWNV